jgi:hypothetical protein
MPKRITTPIDRKDHSMTDHPTLINKAIEDIAYLERLKKDLDPAAGLTLRISIGEVNADEDFYRDIQFGGFDRVDAGASMAELIDRLLADRVASLELRVHFGRSQITRIEEATVVARGVLANYKAG